MVREGVVADCSAEKICGAVRKTLTSRQYLHVSTKCLQMQNELGGRILTKRYDANAHSVARNPKRSPLFPLAKDNSSAHSSHRSHLPPFVTSITRDCG
jgi:hypothetical protein